MAERSGPSVTTASTVVTSLAVQSEHAERARAAVGWTIGLATLGAIALQISPQKTTIHWITTGVVVVTALASTWAYLATRGQPVIDLRKVLFIGVLGTVCVLTCIAYLGVLSPIIMVLTIIIYFWGLGDSAAHGWIAYLACSVGYLVLTVLAVVGVLPPAESVLAMSVNNNRAVIALGVVLQFILAMSFWLARTSRRATLRAMERLEGAHRQVKAREALLAEAQADLNRAAELGKVGRFTGQRVGDYDVGDVIGRGAMGEVYEGFAPDGSRAAIKVLHRHLFEDPDHVHRFFREAQIATTLSSPNVCAVHSSGRAGDGSPYLVMELLRGKDLAQHLRGKRRFGLTRAADMVNQVAAALMTARDAGVVHRDIKPQNVFLSETGESQSLWKVLDFGVSKLTDSATLTGAGTVGTPAYMAPEQIRSQDVDHRADVFALGVIAYRALTGRPAFTAEDEASTLFNVLSTQPVRPSSLVKLDEDVERVLAIAIAKDADERFQDAEELARSLLAAANGNLDGKYRSRADRLLSLHPWGSEEARTGRGPGQRITARPPPRA